MNYNIVKSDYYNYLNILKNSIFNFGKSVLKYSIDLKNKIFKENKITNEDLIKTIEKLKEIQLNINNRIDHINNKIIIFFNNAKKDYNNNNKKSAIFNLKLKKMYMGEKIKLEKINFNIETQIFNIDSFGIIYQTADILKDSAIKINLINKNIDIEKIEDTIEELNELSEIGNEINDVFSTSYIDSYDEDELLKELETKPIIVNEIIENKKEEISEKEITDLKNKLPIVPKKELVPI